MSDDLSADDFDGMMGEQQKQKKGGYKSALGGRDFPKDQMQEDYTKKVTEARNYMLEAMAAAFIKETGLKPSEAELVQQMMPNGIRLYFRKRED
jgi:Mor family transcriptional regulator